MKNFKTFCETQRATRLKEIIQSPPLSTSDKSFFTSLEQKNVLTRIYGHLLSKYFENAVLGRLEIV